MWGYKPPIARQGPLGAGVRQIMAMADAMAPGMDMVMMDMPTGRPMLGEANTRQLRVDMRFRSLEGC